MDFSDEELKNRWKVVAKEYSEKVKSVVPLLQKINNLEKELKILQDELEKRGLNKDAPENG